MSTDFAVKHERARDRLLELLWDRKWHLHKELRVAGVRYSARLLELRRLGYVVDSEGDADGKWYRLTTRRRGHGRAKKVKVYLRPRTVAAMMTSLKVTRSAYLELRRALGSFKHNKHKL